MTTLYEKIARLPPAMLPKLEQVVDLISMAGHEWYSEYDPDWEPLPVDENGWRAHPQPGCMKGTFVMYDNFFEPDDDWEEYM